MGMTSIRLRERLGQSKASTAPAVGPTMIPRAVHDAELQEVVKRYERELAAARARIAELEAAEVPSARVATPAPSVAVKATPAPVAGLSATDDGDTDSDDDDAPARRSRKTGRSRRG